MRIWKEARGGGFAESWWDSETVGWWDSGDGERAEEREKGLPPEFLIRIIADGVGQFRKFVEVWMQRTEYSPTEAGLGQCRVLLVLDRKIAPWSVLGDGMMADKCEAWRSRLVKAIELWR